MTSDPTSLPADELVRHSEWMRRLARALLGDAAGADDVVQAAWVASLERPLPVGRALGPWLARVVRNVASKELRGRSRRERRERAAAKPEPFDDDVAARLETTQRLVEALRTLDEPYRRTLTWRFFDELDTAQIAAREHIEEATVRWRIHRGLQQMRSELDRRHHGNRDAWSVALLPWLGDSPIKGAVLTSAATVQGALAVQIAVKALIAVSFVAAVSIGWMWLREPAHPPEPAAPGFVAAAPPIAEVADERAQPSSASETRRPSESVADATAPAAQAVAASATGLRVRVLDEAHRPIAGAVLTSLDAPGEARSDANGQIELTLNVDDAQPHCRARVAAAHYASVWIASELTPGQLTPFGDVVLPPAAAIRGRVLAPDGTPSAGAQVLAATVELPGPQIRARNNGPAVDRGAPSTTTDAYGEFALLDVAPGARRVWAQATGTRWSWSAPIELHSGESIDGIELRLSAHEDADWIEGVVLDPSGEPAVGAGLSFSFSCSDWGESRTLTLDEHAHFRLGVSGIEPHSFTAYDPQRRWPVAIAPNVLPGTHDLVLRFREPAVLEVEVRTRRGEPVADFALSARTADNQELSLGRTQPIEPGRVRVPAPAGSFVLACTANGYAPAKSSVLDVATLPERWGFVLDPQAGISGVVLAHGVPIAGARLQLHATPERGHCYELDQFSVHLRPKVASEATSDADGRFVLTPAQAGEYFVLATADGFASCERGPFAVSPALGVDGVAIELDQGGAIEGRVLVAQGSGEGLIIAANCGDTFARTVRVDADGRFRFDGLAPGGYQVTRVEHMRPVASTSNSVSLCDRTEFRVDCRVESGRTSHFDLDQRDARPCVVHGTLSWGGAPARGWVVSLWPASGVVVSAEPPTTATNDDGAFELAAVDPGAYRLEFELPGKQGALATPVELVRGSTSFSRTIATARIDVHWSPDADSTARQILYQSQLDGGAQFYAPVPPSDSTLECPAGRGAFGRLEHQSGAQLSNWIALREIVTTPGSQRAVDLP